MNPMAILPEQSATSAARSSDESARQLNRLVSQLISRALPVTTAADLLAQLRETWEQWFATIPEPSDSATHAQFFISFAAMNKLIGSLVGTQQNVETLSVTVTATDGWSVSAATDAAVAQQLDLIAREDSDELATSMSSLTVIPFEHDQVTLGGILLFSDAELTNSGELSSISGSLIAQLNSETSRTEPKPEAITTSDQASLLSQKLEAMAEFAAGAGHEVNNPLGTITGRVALLLKSETDPERRRMLETIGGQAHRVKDMIGDAMTFARPPLPNKVDCNVADLVNEVASNWARKIPAELTVEISIDDELGAALVDPEQFRVVIAGLIRNSVEAIEGSGAIRIQLRNASTEGSQELVVNDTGRCMSPNEREHLFDPFFSGREAGRGLGFGLSKCWQILQMHGGSIEVAKSDNEGTTMIAAWPTNG
jgi:signal transduction histidine kinase